MAASAQSVLTMHPTAYFEMYWSHSASVTGLVESLRATRLEERQQGQGNRQASSRNFYVAHLRPTAVDAGLEDGSILKVRGEPLSISTLLFLAWCLEYVAPFGRKLLNAPCTTRLTKRKISLIIEYDIGSLLELYMNEFLM